MPVVAKMNGCYLVAVFVLAFPSAYGDMLQVHKVSSAYWLFQDQSLSLSCKATNVNDSYSIVWYDRNNENKLYVNTTTGDHLIANTRNGSTLTSTLTLFNARKFKPYKKVTMFCELRYKKTEKIKGSTDYSEPFFFRTFQSKDWPNVTVTPKKVAVDYGAPVTMLCNVRGNLQITKLDVMWIKGGDVLKGTSQSAVGAPVDYAFNLRKTNGSSGGLYMCKALKDVLGLFQDNDTTFVEVYPKLIGSYNKTTYHTVGESVTLTCDIDGYPVNIAWQKISSKKRNISACGRYTIGNNGRTLIIAVFQLEDVGEFSCTSKDKNNRDMVQRFRLVQRANTLAIKSSPTGITYVKKGEVLTLDVSYSYTANRTVRVAWTVGETNRIIERDAAGFVNTFDNRASIKDSASLVLTNTIVADSGLYSITLNAGDIPALVKRKFTVIITENSVPNKSSHTTAWYLILIAFLCGILTGLILLFSVQWLKRRFNRQEINPTNSEPGRMCERNEDKCVNNVLAYAELNQQTRNMEDNYEPLQNKSRHAERHFEAPAAQE